MKYIFIDLTHINAGLSHNCANLNVLLCYCYANNYGLILPIFHLEKFHNNDKAIFDNLTNYFDFNTLLVNNKRFNLVMNKDNLNSNDIIHINKTQYENSRLLQDIGIFKDIKNVPISYSYNENILKISKQIVNTLGNFLCIHVRRTDRLTTKQIKIDTSPPNILTKIKKYNNKNVYIMTNEEIPFFDSLKDSNYNIYFFTHFEILKKLKEEDNYLLFCVENEICNFADKRISTFHTTNTKYIDYLTDSFGWQ